MSANLWLYSPARCDGDFCPKDCDHCEKAAEQDDLISRAAAIDAVYESAVGKQMLSGHRDLIEILKHLPSAQPEPKRGRWIPVSERLPDEAGIYLTTVSRGAIRKTTTRWYSTAHGWEWEEDMPTAWLPLPEPYEEGNDE